jgi:hypothetical protein
MRATFSGSAYTNASVFPITFPFAQAAHLIVTRINADASQTVLVLDTGYSVAGAGRLSGGTVSLIGSVLAASQTLIIERIAPPLQTTDFSNQGEVFPEVAEAAFDYGRMIDQQVEDLLGIYNAAIAKVIKLARYGVDGSSYYDARSNRISNVDDPTLDQDVATRKFVNTAVGGVVAGGGGSFISATVTAAALPSPAVAYDGLVYRVRDAGLPDIYKTCIRQSDGATYEWVVVAAASA